MYNLVLHVAKQNFAVKIKENKHNTVIRLDLLNNYQKLANQAMFTADYLDSGCINLIKLLQT